MQGLVSTLGCSWEASSQIPTGALSIPRDWCPRFPHTQQHFCALLLFLLWKTPKTNLITISLRSKCFLHIFFQSIHTDTQPDFLVFYFLFQQSWLEDLASESALFYPFNTSYLPLKSYFHSPQTQYMLVTKENSKLFHYLWPLSHMFRRLRIMIQELNRVIPRCLEDHQKCCNMAFKRIIQK